VAAAVGCPAAGPCVAVHLPDGDVEFVTGPQLDAQAEAAAGSSAGVTNQQYPERIRAGATAIPDGGPYVSLGLSVNALLQPFGPQIDGPVTFTEMTRPVDGSTSVLQGAELAAPSSFQDGLLPAFYLNSVGNSQIAYARGLRSDPDDVNATDNGVESPSNGRLDLFVHTGSLMTVTTAANRNLATLKRGQPVTFTATSQGAGDPAYTWDFGDGTTATGRSVTHTYTAAGTYEVLVSATGSSDSAGSASPVYAQVSTSAPPSTPPTPPGGGGSAPSTPHPGSSNGGGTGRTPNPSADRHPGASPGTTGSGSASGRASPAPSTSAAGTGTSPPATPPAGISGQLPLVHGQLIGSGAVLLAAAAPAPQLASAVGASTSSGRRAWAVVGAVAVILLLLAAGVWRERRGAGRRRSVGSTT
jgi:hypothetical protein